MGDFVNIKMVYFALKLFTIFWAIGCSNIQDDMKTTDTDNYNHIREVAWEFIREKGWDDTAREDWQSAVVKQTIADNSYELLDPTFVGKEALSVSFKDRGKVVIGTPSILVDPATNEVIGYMPGE